MWTNWLHQPWQDEPKTADIEESWRSICNLERPGGRNHKGRSAIGTLVDGHDEGRAQPTKPTQIEARYYHGLHPRLQIPLSTLSQEASVAAPSFSPLEMLAKKLRAHHPKSFVQHSNMRSSTSTFTVVLGASERQDFKFRFTCIRGERGRKETRLGPDLQCAMMAMQNEAEKEEAQMLSKRTSGPSRLSTKRPYGSSVAPQVFGAVSAQYSDPHHCHFRTFSKVDTDQGGGNERSNERRLTEGRQS